MTIIPAARLVLLLALIAPLFLVDVTLALALDLALLLAAAADAVLSGGSDTLIVKRACPTRLPLGGVGDVFVTVSNLSGREIRLRATDDVPAQLRRIGSAASADAATEIGREEWEAVVGAGDEVRFEYRVRAIERGAAVIGDVHLRLMGPLGLVWRQLRMERRDSVIVQPGLRELRRYRLLAHRNRLREMGLRSTAERGEGSAFESLREYIHGDDPRRVDWKATGKRGTLIVRQMEAERSQSVLLAIDAGRLMTEEMEEGVPDGERRERLDCALAAALLLGEVAAQHGDRVGLFVFSANVDLFLPPARAPIQRLARALEGVQTRMVEPDYPGAFAFLSRQLRRRSLLVLFTDVIDAQASAALVTHLGAATRRHLPLAVTIRNPALELTASAPADGESAVYRRIAAEELLQLRALALATMRRAGVLVADTRPDEAVPTVVNRYLEVKRRGML